jgi:hypothetical protein
MSESTGRVPLRPSRDAQGSPGVGQVGRVAVPQAAVMDARQLGQAHDPMLGLAAGLSVVTGTLSQTAVANEARAAMDQVALEPLRRDTDNNLIVPGLDAGVLQTGSQAALLAARVNHYGTAFARDKQEGLVKLRADNGTLESFNPAAEDYRKATVDAAPPQIRAAVARTVDGWIDQHRQDILAKQTRGAQAAAAQSAELAVAQLVTEQDTMLRGGRPMAEVMGPEGPGGRAVTHIRAQRAMGTITPDKADELERRVTVVQPAQAQLLRRISGLGPVPSGRLVEGLLGGTDPDPLWAGLTLEERQGVARTAQALNSVRQANVNHARSEAEHGARLAFAKDYDRLGVIRAQVEKQGGASTPAQDEAIDELVKRMRGTQAVVGSTRGTETMLAMVGWAHTMEERQKRDAAVSAAQGADIAKTTVTALGLQSEQIRATADREKRELTGTEEAQLRSNEEAVGRLSVMLQTGQGADAIRRQSEWEQGRARRAQEAAEKELTEREKQARENDEAAMRVAQQAIARIDARARETGQAPDGEVAADRAKQVEIVSSLSLRLRSQDGTAAIGSGEQLRRDLERQASDAQTKASAAEKASVQATSTEAREKLQQLRARMAASHLPADDATRKEMAALIEQIRGADRVVGTEHGLAEMKAQEKFEEDQGKRRTEDVQASQRIEWLSPVLEAHARVDAEANRLTQEAYAAVVTMPLPQAAEHLENLHRHLKAREEAQAKLDKPKNDFWDAVTMKGPQVSNDSAHAPLATQYMIDLMKPGPAGEPGLSYPAAAAKAARSGVVVREVIKQAEASILTGNGAERAAAVAMEMERDPQAHKAWLAQTTPQMRAALSGAAMLFANLNPNAPDYDIQRERIITSMRESYASKRVKSDEEAAAMFGDKAEDQKKAQNALIDSAFEKQHLNFVQRNIPFDWAGVAPRLSIEMREAIRGQLVKGMYYHSSQEASAADAVAVVSNAFLPTAYGMAPGVGASATSISNPAWSSEVPGAQSALAALPVTSIASTLMRTLGFSVDPQGGGGALPMVQAKHAPEHWIAKFDGKTGSHWIPEKLGEMVTAAGGDATRAGNMKLGQNTRLQAEPTEGEGVFSIVMPSSPTDPAYIPVRQVVGGEETGAKVLINLKDAAKRTTEDTDKRELERFTAKRRTMERAVQEQQVFLRTWDEAQGTLDSDAKRIANEPAPKWRPKLPTGPDLSSWSGKPVPRAPDFDASPSNILDQLTRGTNYLLEKAQGGIGVRPRRAPQE